MIRGTTPILTFVLPFPFEGVTKANIAFSQKGEVVLEKGLDDIIFNPSNPNSIYIKLTEEDTLALDSNKQIVKIQLRFGLGEERIASDIIHTCVDEILKDGELQ